MAVTGHARHERIRRHERTPVAAQPIQLVPRGYGGLIRALPMEGSASFLVHRSERRTINIGAGQQRSSPRLSSTLLLFSFLFLLFEPTIEIRPSVARCKAIGRDRNGRNSHTTYLAELTQAFSQRGGT